MFQIQFWELVKSYGGAGAGGRQKNPTLYYFNYSGAA